MKKELIKRTLIGIPIGIAINVTILLIVSLVKSKLIVTSLVNGEYNTLQLFITQYIVSIIIGAVAGGSSVIFDIDSWSITKQTVTHFFVFSVPFFICAVVGGWLPKEPIAITMFMVIFLVTYISIWYFQYNKYKYDVSEINKSL